jgi:transposase
MRKALPVMAEEADLLKQRLQQERDGRKKPRLQMLYVLASGQAQTRTAVAQLLGVHRNTISHWLRRYEEGGLEALLHIPIPAGKPVSLPPEVLAAIEQALRQPSGFASYEALRQWVQQTYHLEVNYHTLYTIVRTRFKAKLKVPRPSHTKKTLTPFRPFRRPAGSACKRSSHPRIRVQYVCSARMTVGWAS